MTTATGTTTTSIGGPGSGVLGNRCGIVAGDVLARDPKRSSRERTARVRAPRWRHRGETADLFRLRGFEQRVIDPEIRPVPINRHLLIHVSPASEAARLRCRPRSGCAANTHSGSAVSRPIGTAAGQPEPARNWAARVQPMYLTAFGLAPQLIHKGGERAAELASLLR